MKKIRWYFSRGMTGLKHWSMKKEPGVDGILVTVGLCVIALLLCVVMKEGLTTFVTTLITEMTKEAQEILSGVHS